MKKIEDEKKPHNFSFKFCLYKQFKVMLQILRCIDPKINTHSLNLFKFRVGIQMHLI